MKTIITLTMGNEMARIVSLVDMMITNIIEHYTSHPDVEYEWVDVWHDHAPDLQDAIKVLLKKRGIIIND